MHSTFISANQSLYRSSGTGDACEKRIQTQAPEDGTRRGTAK